MELHTTASEEELNAQKALNELQNQLSPRAKQSHMSVSSYVLSMTEPEQAPMSRCPTSKECGQIIMKLKNEVWDLKCRLHVEKNDRKSHNKSGMATLSAANIQELTREFQAMKEGRETCERKIQDLESKNKSLHEKIQSGLLREEILQRRNQELIHKLDFLDHELALTKLRKTDEDCLLDINKSLMTFQLEEDFPSLPALVPLPADQKLPLAEEHQKQILEFETEVRELTEKLDMVTTETQKRVVEFEDQVKELKEKLDIATEDVTTKSQLLVSLETLLNEKNESMARGDQEGAKLKEKIKDMTEALKELGFLHADEQRLHNTLKTKYRELLEEYESVRSALEQMKQDFEAMASKRDRRTDDISPDLGIESGIEMPTMENALKAIKDNSAEEKIRSLKALNKELATKLRQTKLALDKTLERLSKTSAEKDKVEQAVCRQLHRTHGILRAARKNLENPSEPAVPLHAFD